MTNSNKSKQAGWNLDNSYSRLPGSFFSVQKPSPVESPELVVLNVEVAEELGLDVDIVKNAAEVFAGNELPEGSEPIAQAYAGHQFGHFNMLGDGRAVLLGEQITPQGERVDIQLKGAGRTPYSRGGDGRAALGPMLREYIISEAMDALGIPTTRSLAVVTTGEGIIRETDLPGAVLVRAAQSHIRVGTFQFAANFTEKEDLKALADYTIERHYPELEEEENPYLSLLEEVISRQAKLISQWQMVGFIHGVMNTDNMAISGETIDYGPCAFMDAFDPSTVFSSIDRQGRYAYGNQPPIAGWNLARFAETLLPLLHEDEETGLKMAQEAISEFPKRFHSEWMAGMRAKLGLFNEEAQDKELIDILLSKMHEYGADYTNTFAALTFDQPEKTDLYGKPEFDRWYAIWKERQERQDETAEEAHELMKKNNPAVIPRNFRVEEALEAAVEEGDYSVMERLLDVLIEPYAHSPGQEEYAKLPPDPDEPYQTFCGT
ncbi:YdiU family protein [Bacillus salacetis]|uniref:Protein nucleotidyltransferase YdiU n=1 Tax=Bacillus salacetis TaxID=2315464 RepID=A0A3A1QN09_9BACI|nr:YdiU family protein [Bacillus salacetis]RIW28455.1 YdiU family protein [Bacillus salacetis]